MVNVPASHVSFRFEFMGFSIYPQEFHSHNIRGIIDFCWDPHVWSMSSSQEVMEVPAV